jgi:hypothetical protein
VRVNYFDVNVGQVMCTDTTTNATGLRALMPYFHYSEKKDNMHLVSLVDIAYVNFLT